MELKNNCQGGHITFHINTTSMDNSLVESIDNLNEEVSNPISTQGLEFKKVTKEDDVKKAVDKLNKLFEDKTTHVEYEVYGKFKDITIRIVDNNTKEIIKEMPPKKLIDMIDKLCEMAGVFMDQKA